MQKSFLKNWRDNMPGPLKTVLAPVFRNYLVSNSLFRHTYKELVARDNLAASDIKDVQLKRLRNILIHSFEYVPYYTNLFKEISFDPYQFSSFKEMEQIPFLTRELIHKNFDQLISTKKIKGGYYTATTGGSSGDPLKVLLDYKSSYQENAFIYYNRRALGYEFKDKMATFREVGFEERVWKHSPMQNEIIFSPLKLSKLTLQDYVDKINEYAPQYLNGYLSSIWYFTRLLDEHNIKLHLNLKGIFLMSENIDKKQRQHIESYFGVKSFTHYGHSERCILAREIAHGQYVFDPYYGFTEQVPAEDDRYMIVGTGFLSYTMPLIRYKTDDVCIPLEKGFSIDGKRSSTVGLYGYNNEFLPASAFDLEDPIFRNIIRYQLIQKERGKADLLIIVNSNFSDAELEPIKKNIQSKTKGIMDFNIKIVDSLVMTQRGKLQMYLTELTE